MKFVTFRTEDAAPAAGVLKGGQVISLTQARFPDLISVLAGGPAAKKKAEDFVENPPAEAVHALDSVKLLAPIPRPPKFICVGLNYHDHAVESNMQIPKLPTIFCKWPSCVIASGEQVVLPKNSTQPDYEAEFAFVIGRGGRHIPADKWQDHVFGYTIVNDVSARDVQLATSQWIMGKSFDTFAPMGPYLTSADEIADPHALRISLSIGGETLQDSNTRELIFKIPELIAFLSSVFTLEPGDIVSTGTPAGVGFARKPPRYLKAGDEMVVAIEGLGELRNPVVAEA